MKPLLTIPLLLLCLNGFGQDTLILGNTPPGVRLVPDNNHPGLDSMVIVNSEHTTEDNVCNSYVVYYDAARKYLAYESYIVGDSCIARNYWRNGNLKKLMIYIIDNIEGESIAVWKYHEYYCKNGQLLSKGKIPNYSDRLLKTSFYCNGNKREEYYIHNFVPDGKWTQWHENGSLSIEMFFNHNVRVGEWKYYDETGKHNKTETYKNGELLKQKNTKPTTTE